MAQKTEAFIFKMEKSEKLKLSVLANKWQRSQAGTLRYLINAAASQLGIETEIEEMVNAVQQ